MEHSILIGRRTDSTIMEKSHNSWRTYQYRNHVSSMSSICSSICICIEGGEERKIESKFIYRTAR